MKKVGSVVAIVLLISGCTSVPVEPQAERVIVSPDKAPKGCKYLGQVIGNQGDFFTGGFTSNKNLEEGAMNDMRNKASKMGGNYIQLVTTRAGNTGAGGYYGGGYSETNVTNLGNVYHCLPSSIGE